MPRDLTHIILADEAAKVIKSKEIFDNMDAFHMGCIAEDSFLYTLSSQLSTRLHGGLGDDTRVVVLEMINQMEKEKNQLKAAEQKAFIYGYLCHMAVDSTFHPLIYSISGSQLRKNNSSVRAVMLSKACHRYAETWLDWILMKEKNLSFKKFRPFRKIIANIGMRVRLDDFFTDSYQNALKAKKCTWGDNFDLQAQFHNGMTRQIFVDKITQNQTVNKMVRILDKALNGSLKLYASGFYNFDRDIPIRLTAGSFVHPVTGETIKKSIKDLEHEAIECSVRFIKAIDDYVKTKDSAKFKQSVPNVNLDTGVVDSMLAAIRYKVTQNDFTSITGETRKVDDKPDKKSQSRILNKLLQFCKIKQQ